MGEVAQQLDYDAWGQVTEDSRPGFQPFEDDPEGIPDQPIEQRIGLHWASSLPHR